MSGINAFDTFRQLWELTWWLGRDDKDIKQAREDLETLLFVSPILNLPQDKDLSTIWQALDSASPRQSVNTPELREHCTRAIELLGRTRDAELKIRKLRSRRYARIKPKSNTSDLLVDDPDIEEAAYAYPEDLTPHVSEEPPMSERDIALRIIAGKEAINLGLAPDQLFFCLDFDWLDPGASPPTTEQLINRIDVRLDTAKRTARAAITQPLLWTVSWDLDRILGQIRIASLEGRFPEDIQRLDTFMSQPTNEPERPQISAQLDGMAITLSLYPSLGIAKGHAMMLSPDDPSEILKALISGELSRALRFERLRPTLPFDRPPPSPSKK